MSRLPKVVKVGEVRESSAKSVLQSCYFIPQCLDRIQTAGDRLGIDTRDPCSSCSTQQNRKSEWNVGKHDVD